MDRNTLQKRIMRRIYTAYALRLVAGVQSLRVYAMLACTIGVMQFVSLIHVIQNAMQVGTAGQFVDFVISAISHTESWTLLALVVFTAAAVQFVRTLKAPRLTQFA